jgi:hypothetical protein
MTARRIDPDQADSNALSQHIPEYSQLINKTFFLPDDYLAYQQRRRFA